MSTKTLWIICFALIAVLIVTCVATVADSEPAEPVAEQQTKKPTTFAFELTAGMGKTLLQPAYFYCGDQPVWILDYKNGSSVKYTIQSGNSQNSLCGLKAIDNEGKNCEICITPKEGENVLIEFKYPAGTLWFNGK